MIFVGPFPGTDVKASTFNILLQPQCAEMLCGTVLVSLRLSVVRASLSLGMCSCLVMPSCVTKTIRSSQLERDNKSWTKAKRANRWAITPSFIIRAYGELFSRIGYSDELSPGQLYAVEIMEFFLFICSVLWERCWEDIHIYNSRESLQHKKEFTDVCGDQYSVMLQSGSYIHPDFFFYHKSGYIWDICQHPP